MPTTHELEKYLEKEEYKFKYKKILKSTIYILVIVILTSILISTLIFPVLKIYGNSMEPSLTEGDIVICFKKKQYQSGDIIAFYYNNKVLIKRVIATPSDWVNIDLEGNIYVNDILLEEDYVIEKSFKETDIEYPYQVKENNYFVLGDKREISIDSRNAKIGTINKDDIIGNVLFKLWPFRIL